MHCGSAHCLVAHGTLTHDMFHSHHHPQWACLPLTRAADGERTVARHSAESRSLLLPCRQSMECGVMTSVVALWTGTMACAAAQLVCRTLHCRGQGHHVFLVIHSTRSLAYLSQLLRGQSPPPSYTPTHAPHAIAYRIMIAVMITSDHWHRDFTGSLDRCMPMRQATAGSTIIATTACAFIANTINWYIVSRMVDGLVGLVGCTPWVMVSVHAKGSGCMDPGAHPHRDHGPGSSPLCQALLLMISAHIHRA
jgi:hypothetical protein